MTVWKEPTLADTKRKLRQSLDMTFATRHFILYSAASLVGFVMAILSSGMPRQPEMWIGMGIILAILVCPLLGFYLWRIFRIFRHAEHYSFCRTTLDRPHSGIMRNTMNFSVLIQLPDGTQRMRSTHSIFFAHGFTGPLMEDYINKTVTVGYNEETETVVVIG